MLLGAGSNETDLRWVLKSTAPNGAPAMRIWDFTEALAEIGP